MSVLLFAGFTFVPRKGEGFVGLGLPFVLKGNTGKKEGLEIFFPCLNSFLRVVLFVDYCGGFAEGLP